MKKILPGLAAVCALASALPAHATLIFDVQNISGNRWEYNYTVTNNLGVTIEEISVFFDVGLTDNLLVTASPLGWDGIEIQPDPLIPDDGFGDWLALGPGLAPGGILTGFSISFDFLGSGTPGAQFWEVVDPFTFDALASGETTAISEPAAFWLLTLGLVALGLVRRRNTKTADNC